MASKLPNFVTSRKAKDVDNFLDQTYMNGRPLTPLPSYASFLREEAAARKTDARRRLTASSSDVGAVRDVVEFDDDANSSFSELSGPWNLPELEAGVVQDDMAGFVVHTSDRDNARPSSSPNGVADVLITRPAPRPVYPTGKRRGMRTLSNRMSSLLLRRQPQPAMNEDDSAAMAASGGRGKARRPASDGLVACSLRKTRLERSSTA